jgi:hypothetical protein
MNPAIRQNVDMSLDFGSYCGPVLGTCPYRSYIDTFCTWLLDQNLEELGLSIVLSRRIEGLRKTNLQSNSKIEFDYSLKERRWEAAGMFGGWPDNQQLDGLIWLTWGLYLMESRSLQSFPCVG